VKRCDWLVGEGPSTRALDGSARLPPEQIRDRGAQRREIVGDDPPDDFGIDAPVFVADQVAERTHVRLADIWLHRQKLFGQMPNRFQDDFQSPLHPELEKRVSLEAYLRSPVDSPVDSVDRGEDVLEDDVGAARHQNTRTASRSISLRSFGCRLSRVVTSTLRPIDSFNRRCTPARSSSENFASGAMSTKTSKSLSGRASPRAVDPNRYAASTPRARKAAALTAISAMAWSRVMEGLYTKAADSGMMLVRGQRPSIVGPRQDRSFP